MSASAVYAVSDQFDGKHFLNPEGESGTGGAQRNKLRGCTRRKPGRASSLAAGRGRADGDVAVTMLQVPHRRAPGIGGFFGIGPVHSRTVSPPPLPSVT
jgi:hypothetical protein